MGVRTRYFLGDFLATTLACSLIAVLVGASLPSAWPPWVAMPFSMALGMLLSIPCWLGAGPVLGLIEPMLQIMLGGMVAGMAAGMVSGQEPVSSLAALGANCGACTSLAVRAADRLLCLGGTDG